MCPPYLRQRTPFLGSLLVAVESIVTFGVKILAIVSSR